MSELKDRLRNDLTALDERGNRIVDNLAVAIDLLDKFGVETSRFKVALITSTGKVTAHVFSHNLASARVLEKCGFQQEGFLRKHFLKDKQFIDARLFALLRGE